MTGTIAYKQHRFDEAIATILRLCILKMGLNLFCDYTEPQPK